MDRVDENSRELAAERAGATALAWREHPEDALTVRTTRGEVTIQRLRYRTDPDSGVAYLDVTVDGPAGGDPHYRIVNPPRLVEDPEGDVEFRGRRWREDPLAALAETIARHGGATVRRERRMR